MGSPLQTTQHAGAHALVLLLVALASQARTIPANPPQPPAPRASASPPEGLLCDLKRSPSLGVRPAPSFTWIVPPCSAQANHTQTGYQIKVVLGYSGQPVWDSGKVASSDSTYAPYTGPALAPGTLFQWTVTTWTSASASNPASAPSGECESAPSAPATFVTALGEWGNGTQFISVASPCTFAYFRKEVVVPAGVVSAVAHVAALNADPLLSGYKLYINGTLANLGPGRGEAPVFGGDGQFRDLPSYTLDLTAWLAAAPGTAALALQAMHSGGPGVLMQLELRTRGGGAPTLLATDASWQAMNADPHRNPGAPKHGHSAGTGFIEYIDARKEPVGWKLPSFRPGAGWGPAVAAAPTAKQRANLHSKMEPPMEAIDRVPVRSIRPVAAPKGSSASFLADFGRELQGGLRLDVGDGTAGQTVHVMCGEALNGDTVTATWGWEFDWTLRAGQQTLEQHKYMECRFVSLTFASPATAPANFTLSAWQTHYPWYPSDTHFSSSNATLNAVWQLSAYTLDAASLDTYTDSNTRERRPYEADGIIAATGRGMLQRDWMWARHSHAWVMQNPTWPVEWKQASAFLGWQDYINTGQPDLALAFADIMLERTGVSFVDATGVLKTSSMGRHIVDWMPASREADETVQLGEFTASPHMSVTNFFAAQGLRLLATMLRAGGRAANATRIDGQATRLASAIAAKMWNGTAFCDGICSEVDGHSLVMTNLFSLCFGMVPEAHVPSVWGTVARWGLENIGDYGAFWYQMALGSGFYAPAYDGPDDGTAMLTALTKCDTDSWCSGLAHDNLTMTRESWHDGTYSHEWGTSPIVGTVWGILGVHPSPGFATFTVKPKLGSLTSANLTLPTIRGYINITASPAALDVQVPCNSLATLCLPRSALHKPVPALVPRRLRLDGELVAAAPSGGHLCAAQPVGCGAGGAPRQLRLA